MQIEMSYDLLYNQVNDTDLMIIVNFSYRL